MSRVLKVSRPVRAERRDRGNATSTHTGGLSEDGMRWWNDEHMGIYAPSTQTGGLSENGMHWWTMSTWGLCTYVIRPIYARFVEGRCHYFDILPLQGAIHFKPESWGETQGVAALRSALPWAEIPLPLQGAAVSKPLKHSVFCCVLIRTPRPQNH